MSQCRTYHPHPYLHVFVDRVYGDLLEDESLHPFARGQEQMIGRQNLSDDLNGSLCVMLSALELTGAVHEDVCRIRKIL